MIPELFSIDVAQCDVSKNHEGDGSEGCLTAKQPRKPIEGKQKEKESFDSRDSLQRLRLELSLGFAFVLASRDINPNMLAIISNMQMLVAVQWLIQALRIVA